MAKRMLIDAAHPEETRVVVLSGKGLEEFDFESSTKKQVKGNIYLAKVVRVEPSLQAAFVEYGGNRHGFLAFSEIHPDYYRIPVSDRGAGDSDADEAEEASAAPAEDVGVPLATALPEPVAVVETAPVDDETAAAPAPLDPVSEWAEAASFAGEPAAEPSTLESEIPGPALEPDAIALAAAQESLVAADFVAAEPAAADGDSEGPGVETFGGDEIEETEAETAHHRGRPLRSYKIQEVIKRRQIMLVQVVKEERGNKGAALTTYLSLAGRYCVLMPNTGRGGGVSRKITSLGDRRRLKEILAELEIPEGMGVIVRTAGAERSKAEVRRDYEYLLRLWNEIRELTLKSTAPALIYEEGNLIKRTIRDLYTRDIEEVLVEGEEGYRTAKAFMRTLMPSHAKRVQPYRDPQIGLFQRFQVESQIDAIHSPVAQLRSGGYIVINQAEALVAIDVNSGRATRERNIEETALRTNLEAAEEIVRQLRLRDLAGLIVIDFIDMEEHRNQVAVERRLKEALKNDRARIQVGRISPFGLLEMSRQRLRPSLAETSTQPCPHCGGTGFIRSVESTALYVLRAIEEEGSRRRSAEIAIYVPTNVALYILNQKRESLSQIEARYGIRVTLARDDALVPPAFRLERLRAYGAGETPVLRSIQAPAIAEEEEADEEIESDAAEALPEMVPARRRSAAASARAGEDSEEERGRRRRRRRRRKPEEAREGRAAVAVAAVELAAGEAVAEEERIAEAGEGDGESGRRRRRGRRAGRRVRRREGADPAAAEQPIAAEMVDIVPAAEEARSAAETIEFVPAAEEARSAAETIEFVPAAEEARSAAETIEIVPAAEEARIAAESAAVEAPQPWPGDRGIEAASLSALAGDAPATPHPTPHPMGDNGAPAVATPPAESVPGIPFVSGIERELESVEAAPAAAPDSAAAMADEPQPSPSREPVGEVRTVTERPENPRRGWWQRLIQS